MAIKESLLKYDVEILDSLRSKRYCRDCKKSITLGSKVFRESKLVQRLVGREEYLKWNRGYYHFDCDS